MTPKHFLSVTTFDKDTIGSDSFVVIAFEPASIPPLILMYLFWSEETMRPSKSPACEKWNIFDESSVLSSEILIGVSEPGSHLK
jgi:hypothetical protein